MKALTVAVVGALVLVPLLSWGAAGDTVVTTSKRTLVGTIVEDTPEKIVIRTDSGTVAVPRAAVAAVDRAGGGAMPSITPAKVAPADAAKTLAAAKAAAAAGQWLKAGGLLEGLLDLPSTVPTFAAADRVAATGLLATCYLQVKDARGAARTFNRRADLVTAASDKCRLQAAAEALDRSNAAAIGEKPVATFDEAIAAAMEWKARQLLAESVALGVKATALNEMPKLEAAARRCLDKLDEADLYVPGFSLLHRAEALAGLADNILKAARKAVETCTRDRKILSKYWRTSGTNVKLARAPNERIAKYLAVRQAADEALKNLKALAAALQVPELYTPRDKECTELCDKLDDLQYHEMLPGMAERMRIALRPAPAQAR